MIGYCINVLRKLPFYIVTLTILCLIILILLDFICFRPAEFILTENESFNGSVWYGRSEKYAITDLMSAAACGDAYLVRHLLEDRHLLEPYYEDVNASDVYGNTALHHASRRNREENVELLLNHQGAVDAQNKRGETPFMLAASLGHFPLAATLIVQGANVDMVDEQGLTSLIRCIRSVVFIDMTGVWNCVHFLIEQGAKRNNTDPMGRYPYHWAAKLMMENLAQFLSIKEDLKDQCVAPNYFYAEWPDEKSILRPPGDELNGLILCHPSRSNIASLGKNVKDTLGINLRDYCKWYTRHLTIFLSLGATVLLLTVLCILLGILWIKRLLEQKQIRQKEERHHKIQHSLQSAFDNISVSDEALTFKVHMKVSISDNDFLHMQESSEEVVRRLLYSSDIYSSLVPFFDKGVLEYNIPNGLISIPLSSWSEIRQREVIQAVGKKLQDKVAEDRKVRKNFEQINLQHKRELEDERKKRQEERERNDQIAQQRAQHPDGYVKEKRKK